MPSAPPPQRNWFLKDEPLSDLKGQDRFSHDAYVNLLAKIIKELAPPFTLGVFGSWGVGKSSIVNDLSNRLNRNTPDTRAVTIDVWKYSDNSLRRQFLYDLQESLRSLNVISKGKDYVQAIYQERTEQLPGRQRFTISRLHLLAVPLIIVFVLTGLVLWALSLFDTPIPIKAFVAAIAAPFALYFVSELTRNIVLVSKDTVTRPIYFSEDQFERTFEKIIGAVNCKKLVVVVDNLDRCSHELVVDTLSTIKTFLEPRGEGKCIFVIPCDDSAIRQHVRAAYRVFSNDHTDDSNQGPEQYADEYLRKFFAGSVNIDPFLPGEIESYIEHLSTQMKLTEDMPEGEIRMLVQMVGLLFSENPRQLKQFLNNLTSKYLLIMEREFGPSPQIHPPISSNKLFLAKVVAIETRFPDMYAKLRNDDNLFLEAHSAAVNQNWTDKAKELLKEQEGSGPLLESFLRTTGHITADNPKAFFHLKQSDQEARIPNFSQFESALRRGDIDVVCKAFLDGSTEANEARTEVLIRDIVDWSQKGYGSYALNAIGVAVALYEGPAADRPYLARQLVRVLATDPVLLGSVHQIGRPDALLDMSEHTSGDHQRKVQDAHIDHFTSLENRRPDQIYDAERDHSMARALVTHIDSLSRGQKGRLREGILKWHTVPAPHLKILSSTQQAREALIEASMLVKAVESIDAESLSSFSMPFDPEDEYDATFTALVRCQNIGDQTVADVTAQKLVELLEYATSQGVDELFWYTCSLASRFPALLPLAEPGLLDSIISYLLQKYYSATPEQKAMLVEFMCRHYVRASESNRGNTDNILSSDFIPSIPIDHLAEFVSYGIDPNYSAVPWETIIERLSERLALEGDSTQAVRMVRSIGSALIPDDYELLMSLATRIMERPEIQRTVPLVEQVLLSLPRNNKGKGLSAPVLSATLSLSSEAGQPDNKKLLLDLALRHHPLHTKDYRAKLDDHIFELAVGSDPMGQVGLQALESGYANGALSKERHDAILHRLAGWLVEQPATAHMEASTLESLGKIVGLEAQLPEADSHKPALIQWLADRQDLSLPWDERRQTLRLLASFGHLPEQVLLELVPKVVYQAQNSPDEPTRDAILETILEIFEYNDPLNQDLWYDLDDYRRSLMNGDETEKRVGGRLARQMRKIRQAARQSEEDEAT